MRVGGISRWPCGFRLRASWAVLLYGLRSVFYTSRNSIVLVPTYKHISENGYEGANFTLGNGNRNVPLEKLMSIDMLIIQFS